MLEQQSFAKEEVFFLLKGLLPSNNGLFILFLSYLFLRIGAFRYFYWTLANLRGTIGHIRLLYSRLLQLPLNVPDYNLYITAITRYRKRLFVFAKWRKLYSTILPPFGGTFGIFRPLSSTTSAGVLNVYLRFHLLSLRALNIS